MKSRRALHIFWTLWGKTGPLGAAALAVALAALVCGPAFAQSAPTVPFPKFNFEVAPAQNPQEVALGLQILFLLTVLSLAPSILIMLTSFVRIIIILSLTRNALGTQQMPPNTVLIGIALFLTLFIMAPVGKQINETALQPYLKQEIGHVEALKRAESPIRGFMFSQTRGKDLSLFMDLAKIKRPSPKAEVPTYVLIPAFIISELQTAFAMGFIIYIPFLVIDMVVASTLMSMGMLMLPPVMISLPFKIMVFVLVDGWGLIARSMVLSFGGG